MKMYLGGTPLKSMNIRHFEMNTNDCTMKASDLQAGVTGVSKGQKITGTGKCFEFAEYGTVCTNFPIAISSMINVIEVASLTYPTTTYIAFRNMKDTDFSTSQTIGNVLIDGTNYPIAVVADGATLTLHCDKTITLEVFFGKDNYI